ncbi:hypothetical protein F2Q70_00016858 [Brassica cretica]|uniref:Uncharacterized protein n=1 Tax=Brassica cretica TaxID=69181 RepID=A0A8S9L0Q4_BRACR|nr:hypothetical protein F2Q70_00016858 [Brassica cretica]KAF2599742.1 hypothetical protein F2Q68_00009828 [Brassica cretica]
MKAFPDLSAIIGKRLSGSSSDVSSRTPDGVDRRESPPAVIRPSPVPDPVGSEPSRESLVPEVDESARTKKKGKMRPAPDASITVVQGENRELVVHEESSRGNAALTDDGLSSFSVVPLERGRREPSVDRAERSAVPLVEGSTVPPVLPSSDPGSAPLGASSIVDEEAPAREVGPGDANPVLPAEGRETRPGLDDLVELSDSSIERSGQNESSDGAPPGVGEDLNASSVERGERGRDCPSPRGT